MCLIKTPKAVSPQDTAAAQKDQPVLRNPYLDGINPLIQATRQGSGTLRIDRTPAVSTSPLTVSRPTG